MHFPSAALVGSFLLSVLLERLRTYFWTSATCNTRDFKNVYTCESSQMIVSRNTVCRHTMRNFMRQLAQIDMRVEREVLTPFGFAECAYSPPLGWHHCMITFRLFLMALLKTIESVLQMPEHFLRVPRNHFQIPEEVRACRA
mmetsp:Transcript_14839/g.33627  ORF Transcript_14839/g.33627 Transcript_14839/m.33627 type:complete len:142 (+) Transcript_14839:202-627(+)